MNQQGREQQGREQQDEVHQREVHQREVQQREVQQGEEHQEEMPKPLATATNPKAEPYRRNLNESEDTMSNA